MQQVNSAGDDGRSVAVVRHHFYPEPSGPHVLYNERLSDVWGHETAQQIQTEAIGQGLGVREIQDKLWALSPQNDAQRWLRSKAVDLSGDLEEARAKLLQQIGSAIQWPFLVILIFWLTVIFASFGLFSPANALWFLC